MPAIALDAPVVRSGRVILRQLRPEDLEEVFRWDDDRELVELYGGRPSELARQDSGLVLAIEAEGRLIGLVGLTGETWAMRSAELRVLIGPPAYRGRGLGREAVTALLGRVLATTSLDFIYLRVFQHNDRAIRCYEYCGFRRSGRLRVSSDPRYMDPPMADDLILMTWSRGQAVCTARAPDSGPVLPRTDTPSAGRRAGPGPAIPLTLSSGPV